MLPCGGAMAKKGRVTFGGATTKEGRIKFVERRLIKKVKKVTAMKVLCDLKIKPMKTLIFYQLASVITV